MNKLDMKYLYKKNHYFKKFYMKIKTFREISEAIEYIKKVLKTDEVQKYQIELQKKQVVKVQDEFIFLDELGILK